MAISPYLYYKQGDSIYHFRCYALCKEMTILLGVEFINTRNGNVLLIVGN